jgi:hypothetical protein
MKEMTIEEMLNLSRRKFIERCKTYIEEARGGKLLEVKDPGKCPLAIWVAYNDKKCHCQQVANIASCPLCGNPCCPDCMNHIVDQLSRVTGYLAPVSGWNEAKKQEFKDRTRHEI